MPNDSMIRFRQLVELARTMGLNHLADIWQGQESSLLQNQIRVIILGEFNHGKSSLLNGLFGEQVLPFGVTPTTQIDTWISFGAENKRVSAYSGGILIQQWNWDEWQKLSNHCLPDVLKDKSVDRLAIELDSNIFDESCIFIDTPGLNEAFLARESYLQRYLNRADLLIFVLDANQALTHTEQTVIREFSKTLESEQSILVINKCDRLDDDEWLEICHYVEQTLAPVTGDERFYMVSAKKKTIGDWKEMIERLKDSIQSRKLNHAFDAICRHNAEMTQILEGYLLLWNALEKQPNQIETINQTIKSSKQLTAAELAGILHDISTEMIRMMRQTACDIERYKSDFLRAMPRELDKSTLSSIEDYFEDFIDECYLQFTDSTKHRLIENINTLLQHTLEEIHTGQLPQMSFPIALKEVETCAKNPGSTGAFDVSNSLGLWNLPLPGIIANRAERPRRKALEKMAENAIQIRAEQYALAFENSLKHLHEVLTSMVRETGLQMPSYLSEMTKPLKNGAALDDSIL